MKILGIESSGLVASVGVWEDGNIIGEFTTNFKKTHSQTLLPMLDQLKEILDLDLHSLDAIAVSGGPGSFTGLRIGSATAKGLGLALDLPLIHVSTLEALAYNAWGVDGLLCPIMDARRNQVYTAVYEWTKDGLQAVLEPCPMDISELIAFLQERGVHVLFLGDGVPVYEKLIQEQMKVPYDFAPAHMNRQNAAALLALAAVYCKQGKLESAAEHRPDYLRLSQAERERLEKENANS